MTTRCDGENARAGAGRQFIEKDDIATDVGYTVGSSADSGVQSAAFSHSRCGLWLNVNVRLPLSIFLKKDMVTTNPRPAGRVWSCNRVTVPFIHPSITPSIKILDYSFLPFLLFCQNRRFFPPDIEGLFIYPCSLIMGLHTVLQLIGYSLLCKNNT